MCLKRGERCKNQNKTTATTTTKNMTKRDRERHNSEKGDKRQRPEYQDDIQTDPLFLYIG
jgi:hypothetical protein